MSLNFAVSLLISMLTIFLADWITVYACILIPRYKRKHVFIQDKWVKIKKNCIQESTETHTIKLMLRRWFVKGLLFGLNEPLNVYVAFHTMYTHTHTPDAANKEASHCVWVVCIGAFNISDG